MHPKEGNYKDYFNSFRGKNLNRLFESLEISIGDVQAFLK